MNLLGIETSCDETAAAVVSGPRQVLSSVVLSQADLHGVYGGVVPEVASRQHMEWLPGVIEDARRRAGLPWDGIDGIAVTYGPGLATSLLVGIAAAKGLSIRLGKPLFGVNHIESHIYAVFLSAGAPSIEEVCPFIALVVSGGHTCLVRVEALGRYRLLGQTIDDAAGEAFDKGAKLLGLGYPGGPVIDKASRGGDPAAVPFPRGRQRRGASPFRDLDERLCFSFSGLKTALLYYLREHPVSEGSPEIASIAASYQEAIVDALVKRCERAVPPGGCLAVGGGVSLNKRLREKLQALSARRGIRLLLAEPKYCADNAAMIAGLAAAGSAITGPAAMDIDAEPSLPIAGACFRS